VALRKMVGYLLTKDARCCISGTEVKIVPEIFKRQLC
jgi:hypothetical protein